MSKLTYLRAEAKKHGLTFKALNLYLNGRRAYQLFNRETGQAVGGYTTIACAYDDQRHTNYFSEYKGVK